jgi:hypothetical protein
LGFSRAASADDYVNSDKTSFQHSGQDLDGATPSAQRHDPARRPAPTDGAPARGDAGQGGLFNHLVLSRTIVRALPRKPFGLVQLRVTLFVIADTIMFGARWIRMKGGYTALAEFLLTGRTEVRDAVRELCDGGNGHVLVMRQIGQRIYLRVNPRPTTWGDSFQSPLAPIRAAELNANVTRDPDDKQADWIKHYDPDFAEALRDSVLECELVEIPPLSKSEPVEKPPLREKAVVEIPPLGDSGLVEFPPVQQPHLEVHPSKGTLKPSKRQRADPSKGRKIDPKGLPEIPEHELRQPPRFRHWPHYAAWILALEEKYGGWLGVGDKETWVESYGGQWWKLYKENPKKFCTVWTEALSMARDNRIKDSIGGTARDLWNENRLGG